MSGRLGALVRFTLVGAGGYGVNVLGFSALYQLGWPYAAASVVAYFLANALMYLGNRYFTFRLGHGGFWGAYRRYVLVGAVVAGLVAGLLAALVEGLGVDPRLGQGLALASLTPVAFLLIRRWSFQLRAA